MASKPSLRTELLFNLAFLAAAALLLGVGTILLASTFAPERAFPLVLTIVALDVGIFIVFGHYIVTRHVLRPVERLMAVADAVVGGDLVARAPDAETSDFATLAARLNRMTDHLLDAQSQLVRSEKLASIGRLAAGIAHEVGNPLGAMGTYVEVLRRRGGDPEVVQGLTRELDRIDAIIRGLLDYARPREEPLQPIEPGAVLRSTFALLEAQGAFKPVRAALDVADGVPRVMGRGHLLEQALVNLRGVLGGGGAWSYSAQGAGPTSRAGPLPSARATTAASSFPEPRRAAPRAASSRRASQGLCCSSLTPVPVWRPRTASASSTPSSPPGRRDRGRAWGSPSWPGQSTTWGAWFG